MIAWLSCSTTRRPWFISSMLALVLLTVGLLRPAVTTSTAGLQASPASVYLPLLTVFRPQRIAFFSTRDGQNNIYLMRSDGSQQTRLTTIAADGFFAWSRDGSKLAFTSYHDGHENVYSINADGSHQTRLTNTSRYDYLPRWSPDGTKILFYRQLDDQLALYVMDATGANQTRLTTLPLLLGGADWSPDGTQIVFVAKPDATAEIYVMNADGSAPTRLTHTALDKYWPVWSPDGQQIVFAADESNRDGPTGEIDSVNRDGSGLHHLLTTPGTIHGMPVWSPDGSKILFVSVSLFNDNHGHIAIMNADGTNAHTLTDTPQAESFPAWSPDGAQIAFSSELEGHEEVYVMNVDGSGQTRLTTSGVAGASGLPLWAPKN